MTEAARQDYCEERDLFSLQRIRQKFQIVFGNPCTIGDYILIKRYRVSPEGDLIMIIS